jgi:L-iditol 2-dehydrogenase
LDDAALTEPTSVVVHALRRSGLLSLEQGNAEFVGKHALILGAGFLGQIAARILARHCPGLVVHVCDRNRHKIELVRPFVASADVVSDDVEMATFKARHASGFHYVFEAAGTPQSYLNSVELAAPGGVVVWIGNISDDLTLQKKTVSSILRKELNVLGAWNSSYDGAAPSDWTAALDLMSSSLHLSSLVSHRIGLDDLPAALRKMDAHLRRTERHEIVKVLVGS